MPEIILVDMPLPGGLKVALALPAVSDDPIVAAYKRGEQPNDYMLRLLCEFTSPGDAVIDLGCHVGTFCVSAAALGRQVLAVDANRLHIDLVERSRAANGLQLLKTRFCAVAATEGPVSFNDFGLFGFCTPPSNSKKKGILKGALEFLRALLPARQRSGVEAVSAGPVVPGLPLDRIAREFGAGKVSFLKMDIEGAELDAVTSGRHFLAADQPTILFESNPMTASRANSNIRELRSALEAIGYKVFRIEGERWIYAPPDQPQPEAWVDMLALPEAQLPRWKDRIVWIWTPHELLEKCKAWSQVPHRNVKEYLLREALPQISDSRIRKDIRHLKDALKRELAETSEPH